MPDIANPFVKNLPQASLEQENVATLKTEDGYSWDKDILLYLFYERDHNLINLISLYRCFVADKWTWIWDTNVLNSVKKGCKKLMKGTSSLTGAVTSSFWNSIWNSTMAPKVKKKIGLVCALQMLTNFSCFVSKTCPCNFSFCSERFVLIACSINSYSRNKVTTWLVMSNYLWIKLLMS